MIKRVCFLLALVCVISEVHSVVYKMYPESATMNVSSWFISPPPFEVSVLWWLKGLEDTLKWCIVYFSLAQVAKNYSTKLFYVACLLVLKSMFSMVMFLYNYSQSYGLYWVSVGFFIGVVITMFSPIKDKNKGAIVKSIE